MLSAALAFPLASSLSVAAVAFRSDVSFASLQAFEQQAIGRIRRYPQKETVRVYRLFAAESVEEGLYSGGFAR